MNKFLAALQSTLKAFTLRFGGSRWAWSRSSLGGTSYRYARAETAAQNSIVQAVVRCACRIFPEAPLEVQQRDADGDLTSVPDHALTALLERPNAFYSGLQLWTATLADYLLTGNAYWVKVRSGAGRVVELWWLPAGQVEPRWPDDGTRFIDRYEYTVEGQIYSLDPQDVVHFRDGFDPANIRKGRSPLAALLREVATDDEAANYSASMLRNLGVPGVVISPGAGVQPTDTDLEEIKTTFQARFGGDNRGAPLVLRGPAEVSVLSFSPEQMQMRELRRIPEERITAIYGIAAVVVGLGAGLDRSTFSNMAEAREAAYESMIIPLQRLILADLQHQLVPDFGDARTLRLAYDYSAVRILQADHNALMERAVHGFQGGLLTRGEARQLVGQEADALDEVFALGATMTLLPRDAALPADPAAEPPAAAPAPLALVPGAADWQPVEYKAADDVVPRLERARDRQVPIAARFIAGYLQGQRDTAIAHLERTSKAQDAAGGDADERALRGVLEGFYRTLLHEAHAATQAGLGLAFGLPDALTTEYLAAAGAQITSIVETTRQAVAAALQAGQAAGEGIPELRARLQALPAFDRARAEMIARTELANAANEAAVTTYRASGVVHAIRVLDSDADELCAAWNGRVVPLRDQGSIPRLGHPNCQRALAPVVQAAEGAA